MVIGRALINPTGPILPKGALQQKWHEAMPSFNLCPDVIISDSSKQIAKAVTEISKLSAGKIALAGHPAGGHLVALIAVGDHLSVEIMGRISHVMPISPVGNLSPLH